MDFGSSNVSKTQTFNNNSPQRLSPIGSNKLSVVNALRKSHKDNIKVEQLYDMLDSRTG